MERRQLEYFLAVVDHGSMSRAARALVVSQPAVSHAIRVLERQVGSNLFERRASRLVLTQSGTALVGPAREVMRKFLAAERSVAQVVSIDRGRLDLAIPQILAIYPTAELLTRFARAHPHVQVHIEDQATVDGVWDAVKTGRDEIGFVTTLTDSDLKAVLLGTHRLVAVLPPGSPDDGVPMRLEEVASTRWISGLPMGFASRIALEEAMEEAGLAPQRLQNRWIIATAHRQAIPRLVLSGAAPALLIAEEAEDLQAFGAVLRPIEPGIERPYYLVHRRERLSAVAQEFLELTLQVCRSHRTAGGARAQIQRRRGSA